MLKIKVAQRFDDGRKLYSYFLLKIKEINPELAARIHDDQNYKPFRIVLPDLVYVLTDDAVEITRHMSTIKVLNELVLSNLKNEDKCYKNVKLSLKNVTFRKEGFDAPMPDADTIIGSLQKLRNQLYDDEIGFSPGSRRKRNYVLNQQFDVKSHKYQVSNYRPHEVCSGSVTIKINGDDEYVRQINTLLQFATWAGVGHKRTMGMGEVSIVKKW